MGHRIVVLGAGTGGTQAANRLRRRCSAGAAQISVVDQVVADRVGGLGPRASPAATLGADQKEANPWPVTTLPAPLGPSALGAALLECFALSVSIYWFPAYGHPDGVHRDRPWFRIEGEWGYRAAGHPDGASDVPCLRIVEDRVQRTFSLPHNADADANFQIVGSFVYLAGVGGAPWFRVQRSDESARSTGLAPVRAATGAAPG